MALAFEVGFHRAFQAGPELLILPSVGIIHIYHPFKLHLYLHIYFLNFFKRLDLVAHVFNLTGKGWQISKFQAS